MKLQDVMGKYAGKRIGVLGSGPTLNEYKGRINSTCDIVIACNGSLMALESSNIHINYFACMDSKSPTRQWFAQSEKFKNKEGEPVIRIMPYSLLPFDASVIISEDERKRLGQELSDFVGRNPEDTKAHRRFVPEGNIALRNGIGLQYETVPIEEVNIDKRLYNGGTVTGLGLQLAWRMGASQINLFGCGFNNAANKEVYAYDNKGEFGETTEQQREYMNEFIRQVGAKGVDVRAFGETQLKVEQHQEIINLEKVTQVTSSESESANSASKNVA